jgi:hypothetical protein
VPLAVILESVLLLLKSCQIMSFMSKHVIQVKSCHSCQNMSFMSNHVIHDKSCLSCQIMSFMSNHVESCEIMSHQVIHVKSSHACHSSHHSCHSCHHSYSVAIKCVIIGILDKVGVGGQKVFQGLWRTAKCDLIHWPKQL